MMPEYDGYFALENILKKDTNAKVIMVTADKTSDTRKKLIELKASGILYKPYEIKTVLETIEKVKNGETVLDMIHIKQKIHTHCVRLYFNFHTVLRLYNILVSNLYTNPINKQYSNQYN